MEVPTLQRRGGDLSQVTSLSYMFNEASQVQLLTGDWDTVRSPT